jgi:hypothetical protein
MSSNKAAAASGGGKTAYQRQQQGKKSAGKLQANFSKPKEKSENTEKKRQEGDQIDSIFGFERYKKVRIVLFSLSMFAVINHHVLCF